MTVLPFHYCFGASLLHTHFRVGGSLVIDRTFVYLERFLMRLRETGCTGFSGVPTHFQVLLRRSRIAKMTFPALRFVLQAGGHLAPVFLRELRDALPNTRIFVSYGQTEATARLSYLPPDKLTEKIGSIGIGIPGVKLQVFNEKGQPVRPGETGEIVAEGRNITRGYWGAEDETAARFRNGKLYTNDLATVDEDGYIFIAGRAADFLKCGGKRVSCRAIEEKLLEYDGLVEAAVIGTPDEVLGEAVLAFVVAKVKDSPDFEQNFLNHCRRSLPLPFLPKKIVVLDSLPKNHAGKVLKSSLRGQS